MEKINIRNEDKYSEHVELILFVSDPDNLDQGMLNRYTNFFNKVTISSTVDKPTHLVGYFEWKTRIKGETKVQILNSLITKVNTPWMMFIEEEETIRLDEMTSLDYMSESLWSPCLVLRKKENKIIQHYQMRLVSTKFIEEKVFSGVNLPDCTRFMIKNSIAISDNPILIDRTTDLFSNIVIEEELSILDFSPQLYLIEGDRLLKNGKYVHAAAQYRQILKMERLLPFDRLAAVNGLTTCLTEQHKWDQAITLAQRSIEAEAFQGVPYLIKYKIAQLKKQWPEALEALSKYYECKFYEHISLHSKASYDVSIAQDEVLITLASLALKASETEKGYEFMNELYKLKNGEVDVILLHKLMLYSIELNYYQKAIFFFHKLYDNYIACVQDVEKRKEINSYMDMFMKMGWYGFICEVYSNLNEAFRDDHEYRRRLIASLVKMGNVEEARKLATNVA